MSESPDSTLPAKREADPSAGALPERWLGNTRQFLIFPTRGVWQEPAYQALLRPVMPVLGGLSAVLAIAFPWPNPWLAGLAAGMFVLLGWGSFERWLRFKAKRNRRALDAGEGTVRSVALARVPSTTKRRRWGPAPLGSSS